MGMWMVGGCRTSPVADPGAEAVEASDELQAMLRDLRQDVPASGQGMGGNQMSMLAQQSAPQQAAPQPHAQSQSAQQQLHQAPSYSMYSNR